MNEFCTLCALYVLAATTAQANTDLPSPADDPENWLLAFVDVETTGDEGSNLNRK